MPRRPYTPRELDVMSVLWDLGSSTVAGVKERLVDPVAYTTVLSFLQTLDKKGLVRHEVEWRAYRYYPTLDRRTAGRRELDRLLKKVFKGSPQLLLVQLLSDFPMNAEQLQDIHDLIGAQKPCREPGRPAELAAVVGAERFLAEITTTANLQHPCRYHISDASILNQEGSDRVRTHG